MVFASRFMPLASAEFTLHPIGSGLAKGGPRGEMWFQQARRPQWFPTTWS